MNGPSLPPHVVLPAGADLDAATRPLTAKGWLPRVGFTAPAEPWDLGRPRHLAVGAIRSEADAAAALLVAVRGAGVVVSVDEQQPWASGFLADLGRIASADREHTSTMVELTDEQRRLFDLLGSGASIAEAARVLYLSLRTANRRIAEARASFGAKTTSEAVVAYIRMRDTEAGR